jgi:hypothetical protein
LKPDLVYIDADHSFEAVVGDLECTLDLFPGAAIVGDDWNWESVRTAVERVVKDRQLACESHETGWKIAR